MSIQRRLFTLLVECYENASKHYVLKHKKLCKSAKDNAQTLAMKGEVPEKRLKSFEQLEKYYGKLQAHINALSAALNQALPELPKEDEEKAQSLEGFGLVSGDRPSEIPDSIWDDDETRQFYEVLLPLRESLPAALFGGGKTENDKAEGETAADGDAEPAVDEVVVVDGEEEAEEAIDDEAADAAAAALEKELDAAEESDPVGKNSRLDELLTRLPECVNQKLVDKATEEFCYMNSKGSRKRLARAIFLVPRTRFELFRYYARMVANLNQVMRDIGQLVQTLFETEFRKLFRKRDQILIESRIRNARMLGELCKFGVIPPAAVFSCLKKLIDDWSNINVEIACQLVESCGRFLYRKPETHAKMNNMLTIMMRKKEVKRMDMRLATLVENAFFFCKPPENTAAKKAPRVLTPMEAYVEYLVHHKLASNNVRSTVTKLRKMPYPATEDFIVQTFLRIHKCKFSCVGAVAAVVSSLANFQPSVGVKVVDLLLHRIRLALMRRNFQRHQRQMMEVKLLAELYNYCLFESPIIFDTLYLILFLGNSPDPRHVNAADPPTDFFRIRLVCTILETCGTYFVKGAGKKRLDRFLVYFQRYIYTKGPLPLEIDFLISDLFDLIRPAMPRHQSFAEAHNAALEMERQEREAMLARQKLAAAGGAGADTPVVEFDLSAFGDEEDEEEEVVSDSSEEEGIDSDEEDDVEESFEESDEDSGEDYAVQQTTLDEEEHLHLPEKAVAEDPEFDRELAKMMQESLDVQRSTHNRVNLDKMSIPMSITSKSKAEAEPTSGGVPSVSGQPGVQFSVMLRKGATKHTTKSIVVPSDSGLTVNVGAAQDQSAAKELEEVKRYVLDYERRGEDDKGVPIPRVKQRVLERKDKR